MGKNGKWIYYYRSKPKSIRSRLGVYAKEKAERDVSLTADKVNHRYDEAKDLYNFNMRRIETKAANAKDDNERQIYDKAYKDEQAKLENETRVYRKSMNNINRSIKDYYNTPIGKIDKASNNIRYAFTTGLEYLKNLFGSDDYTKLRKITRGD